MPAGSISVAALRRRVHLSGGGGGRIDNRPRVGWPHHDLGKRRMSSPTTALFSPTETLCCRRRPRSLVLNEATDRHIRRESQTPSPQPSRVSQGQVHPGPGEECRLLSTNKQHIWGRRQP